MNTMPQAAIEAVRRHAADLVVYLGIWADRDDNKPQPDVRQAANHAMEAIDAALAELHGLRAQLVGEIRDSDDATEVRARVLLEQCRQMHQEGETNAD